MTKEVVGRLAFASLLGILWALILSKTGDTRTSIALWLLCILIIGITLNTQEGEPFKVLAAGSGGAATVMIATLLFLIVVGKNVIPISGVEISPDLLLTPFVIFFGSFLWVVSMVGALVACLARPAFLGFLGNFIESEGQLNRLESALNGLAKVVGTAVLFWKAFF